MEKLELKDDRPVTVTMTFHRPENDQELMEAINAPKFNSVLWHLDQWLRNHIKHGDDEKKAEHYQEVRTRLWECLEEEGLSLE